MLKSLFFILHNSRAVGKIVGELLEIKLVTSLLLNSRNAGNLKLFWCQVHTELQRKTPRHQRLALSSSHRDQNVKENAL